ncbi:MAG: hypothetical protein AB9869_04695 [Verrucomicrobiia bacterium]
MDTPISTSPAPVAAQAEPAPLTDRAHEELLALYQVTIEDIERSKQWLWTVTYNTIVAEGGLLALRSAYFSSPGQEWATWLLGILCVGVAAVGSFQVHFMKRALVHFRERVDRCYVRFEGAFIDVFGSRTPKHTIPHHWIIWIVAVLVLVLMFFPGRQ